MLLRGRAKQCFSAVTFTHVSLLNSEGKESVLEEMQFCLLVIVVEEKSIPFQISGQACQAIRGSIAVSVRRNMSSGCSWYLNILAAVSLQNFLQHICLGKPFKLSLYDRKYTQTEHALHLTLVVYEDS